MKSETIERATRVLAMLNVMLWEIDELAKDGMFFRQEVKMAGKAFVRQLEIKIKTLYDNMDEEAVLYYNKEMELFEAFLKAYMDGSVEVQEDKEILKTA